MLLSALKKIGFTQQEAIIYIYLCKHGDVTGYEVAKHTGISRSNAYAALSSLLEKGYAHLIEGTTSKYVAVSKIDLIKNAEREFNSNIQVIEKELEFNTINQEPYITITGESHVLDKTKNIIEASEKRIYLSCSASILDHLAKELTAAIERNLKIVVLSSKKLIDNNDYTHYLTKEAEGFKLIADTSEVIAGNINQCLYSKNKTLLTLIRESFINEISVMEANNN